jgi:hypothetical protein
MTSSQDPEAEPGLTPEEPTAPASQQPARRQRPPRPAPERTEPDAALDPRLVRLERQTTSARSTDIPVFAIALIAFVFGVAINYWIATSILNGGGSGDSSNAIEATSTVADAVEDTPTVAPQATATPQPDRTNCDEIRGTQYRSVTEREFFLANCT